MKIAVEIAACDAADFDEIIDRFGDIIEGALLSKVIHPKDLPVFVKQKVREAGAACYRCGLNELWRQKEAELLGKRKAS